MDSRHTCIRSFPVRRFAVGAIATLFGALAAAASPVTTADLLKDPKFKSAYRAALGSEAAQKWLIGMTNSGQVYEVILAGETFQVATPCKPHDCADNNLLLLYSPAKGLVYGHLHQQGRATLLGAPGTAMRLELQRLWRKEFRQQ